MAVREDPQWGERKQAVNWVTTTFAIAFLSFIVLLLISLPLVYIIDNGFSKASVNRATAVFIKFFNNPAYIFDQYWSWFKIVWSKTVPFYYYIPYIPLIVMIIIIFGGIITNPFGFESTIGGGGRLAFSRDIKAMKLFNGFIIVLGKFKGKFLRLPETLSVLACAPPGTGKTVAIVVPTIFHSENISIIVNDPKPELCYLTSGFRATQGPVFIINWAADDNPKEGIYYPCWNPLSPTALPPEGPERDMYIDAMVNVLVEEPTGGADPHWSKTGRAALAGFMHFLCCKCEKAIRNDYFLEKIVTESLTRDDRLELEEYYLHMPIPEAVEALQELRKNTLTLDTFCPIGTWDLLPNAWKGREPCLSMILDWLTEAQMEQAHEIRRRQEEGDQMAVLADPMKDLLEKAVEECRRYNYSQRAVVELSQLGATPDKERGSILSTGLTGIAIFKNSAVKNRTKSSDFKFKDLRGMKEPGSDEYKAVSVYISVNQSDAAALSLITGIFIELMSTYLISNPPNNVHRVDGKMGPFPVLFVLDEFPQMPRLGAVIDGPAVGRGQKISYLLIGQDLGQISGKYGPEAMETIISTTAAKIILPQNNENTAGRFAKMIGTMTIKSYSWDEEIGLFANNNPFKKKVGYSLQGSDVLCAVDFLALNAMKQVVLFQGFLNRPIMADSPRYYLDPKMLKLSQIPTAKPVPEWVVARRPVQKPYDVKSALENKKQEDKLNEDEEWTWVEE